MTPILFAEIAESLCCVYSPLTSQPGERGKSAITVPVATSAIGETRSGRLLARSQSFANGRKRPLLLSFYIVFMGVPAFENITPEGHLPEAVDAPHD